MTAPALPLIGNVEAGTQIGGSLVKPAGNACTNSGPNGLGIPGVDVNLQTSVSGCYPGSNNISNLFTGSYAFPATPTRFDYTIKPTKSVPATDVCCGVTALDVLALKDIILGVESSPLLWKAMAGDFDASGGLSTMSDLVPMQRCVTGLNPFPNGLPANWTPWRFAPLVNPSLPNSTYTFFDLNTVASSSTAINAPGPFVDKSFWGVKRGDLDGDCIECGINLTGGDPTGDRSASLTLPVQIPELSLAAGEEALIPVLASLDGNLSYFGTEIQFDADKVEVVSIENGAFSDEFSQTNIRKKDGRTSALFSWLTMEKDGVPIKKGNPTLFSIRLKAKKDIPSLREITSMPQETLLNFLFLDGVQYKIGLAQPEGFAFSLRVSGENPVNDALQLEAVSPVGAIGKLVVFNGQGQPVLTESRGLQVGGNKLDIDLRNARPGLYTARMVTPQGSATAKFIKI